ncbi:MAG TPA: phosphoribosylanthranilate isomerase [Chthoniobacterales bacterium]|nr:phosphoribosylanthranilate isomerase [Chthoniobacterales bacterium]
MLRVKICGLTTPQDAAAAVEFGADALGFNFFPGSKRYVRMETARDWIAMLPDQIEKVGIVVNPSWDDAKAAAGMAGITALQLHGAETPEFCRRLKEEGIRFEKALPVSDPDSVAELPYFFTGTVLLDSGAGGEFGGSGQTFPWEIARDFVQGNPSLRVILAGGLTPENVAEAVALVRPFGVDVTSGVESSPGRKDYRRLRAFIAAVRRA